MISGSAQAPKAGILCSCLVVGFGVPSNVRGGALLANWLVSRSLVLVNIEDLEAGVRGDNGALATMAIRVPPYFAGRRQRLLPLISTG